MFGGRAAKMQYPMNATVKAELDSVNIQRAPTSALALNGASAYTFEQLKPQIQKQLGGKGNFAFSNTQPQVAGRGPATWVPAHEQPHGVAELLASTAQAGLDQQLAGAEYAAVQQQPVVHHDLHEIAEKKTRELMEKDAMKLHFKAFMYERVEDSELERERTRVFELHYHVTDGKLKVHEPMVDNSGLWQGDWAKPHVPFKPDGSGQPYSPSDFVIGATVYIYGHPFTICDANSETRALMASRYGIELGPPLPVPQLGNTGVYPNMIGHRPHINKVACDVGDMEDPVRGFYKRAGDTKGKFLEHGNAMLRFEAEWRETAEPFGDRRSFAVQYYLADDTLEILDKSGPHSRAGQFTKFVARQRLPRLPLEAGTEAVVPIGPDGLSSVNAFHRADMAKASAEGVSLPDPGEVMAMSAEAARHYRHSEGPTVWGRYFSPITGDPIYTPTTAKDEAALQTARMQGTLPGPVTIGGFPVLSSLRTRPESITAPDLICGGVISVFGRPLLLKTCDPYTVAFGLQKLGIDQRRGFITSRATVASERAAVAPHSVPRGDGKVPLPAHAGVLAIGSEEETRVNAGKAVPTYRSERNFDKFMQLSGKVLRFEARLDPACCTEERDTRREFVISFYLEDETVAVVEVLRDRKGATAIRWLSRGKHRNAVGTPELAAQLAVIGVRGPVPLEGPAQAAYDRVFMQPSDKYGFGETFGGQGYPGGILGKQDRVGAGGTGVPSAADVGVRDPLTHAWSAPPSLFNEKDFYPGARLTFAHAPGQTFILTKPDGFTSAFISAKEAQAVDDPRDVLISESATIPPLPALPYESLPATGIPPGTAPRLSHGLEVDCLTMAKLLAGVHASVLAVLKQGDKLERGYAPQQVVLTALARYGVSPPAIPADVLDRVIEAFTIGSGRELTEKAQAEENARATKHSNRHLAPKGGSPTRPGSSRAAVEDNPVQGSMMTDYRSAAYGDVLMVSYPTMLDTIKAVAARQGQLQPRLEKLIPQLRSAILSSRKHLRKVFRELDTAGTGAITFREFKDMLNRHHLDVGLNDAQVRSVMMRFPLASAEAAAKAGAGQGEPCLDWRGFVEAIVDARTLAPGELETILDFIRGVHDVGYDSQAAKGGVGGTRTTPAVFPHVNQVTSWSAQGMDLRPYGIKERPELAPQQGVEGSYRSTGAPGGSRPGTATEEASKARNRITGPANPPMVAIHPQPSHKAPRVPLEPPAAEPLTEVQAMNSGAHDYLASYRRIHQTDSHGRPLTAAVQGQGYAAQPPVAPARPYTAGPRLPTGTEPVGAASHRLPVNVAPDLPGAAPRAVPFGSTDPRLPPARPVLDVVAVLSSDAQGAAVLHRMRSTFGTRRLELYRSLALYDTSRKHLLDVPAFISALQSAGMKMSNVQSGEFQRMLLVRAAAGGPDRALPYPHDVYINYNSFLDDLYGQRVF